MRSLVVAAAAALCLSAAGCAGDDSSDGESAGTKGGLSFSVVEGLTADRFTKDPNCPVGKWDTNSTGVDEEYRADVAEFKQFDCYKSASESLPTRVQQSKFVSFKSAATARKYAEDEKVMYPVLLVGSSVVVAGTGLDSVDMDAYLADLKGKAGSGEIMK